MPNRNYAKGSADERAVRRHAESVGCEVVRAAGSHGTDLVVIDRGRVYAVDVKRNAWASPASRAEMARAWRGKGAPWLVMVRAGPGHARTFTYRRVKLGGRMGEPVEQAPWL